MSSVQEIEAAIQTLPPHYQNQLFLWMEQQYAQRFDNALERDIQRGALGQFIDQTVAENQSGNSRSL